MRVKSKVILAASLLSAVAFLLVWAFAFQTGMSALDERSESLLDLACHQLQDDIAYLAESMAKQTQLLASDKSLLASVAAGRGRQLNQRLSNLSNNTPNCRGLLVVDPYAKVIGTVGTAASNSAEISSAPTWTEPLGSNLKANSSLRQALQGTLAQGPDLYVASDRQKTNTTFWQVAAPLTHEDRTIGALLASYSWDSLVVDHLSTVLRYLEQAGFGKAKLSLLNNRQIVLASTEPQLVGQKFIDRKEWFSFFPATILDPQQVRIVLTIPKTPVSKTVTDLKTKTFFWSLLGGVVLMLGLCSLAYFLFSRRLGYILHLSRKLLHTVDSAQPRTSADADGDEMLQLTCILEQANTELINRQQNMQNLMDELESLNKELAQADQLKNEFVANMSHEIRTPMNGILGFAELLSQEELNKTQREYVGTILKCGSDLLILINNVLDLARIEAGHLRLCPEPCSIRQLVAQACEISRPQAEQKKIKLTWQFNEDVPETLGLDGQRLQQILTNLINNGVKFTDRGFVNVNVGIAWKDERRGLSISIADSGIGIAKDKNNLIFKPFVQIDGSESRSHGGTGLGLAICRELIDALGGSIYLDSVVGAGSEFVLWVPFENVNVASGQIGEPEKSQPVSRASSNISKAKSSSTPASVLVVEDDRICCEFFKAYLARNGYNVLTETDGNKAVDRIKQTKPDAVILDLRLPGKNGLDILAQLKNEPDTEAIPVIVCSVLRCEDKALNLGALEYLKKPFTGKELLRVVQRAIQQRRTAEILAVDDESTVRRLYEVALTRAGFKVITASGGREALELLTVHPQVGLVLLDLVMPGMSGFEVLERIRHSGRKDLPVIVVTARAMTSKETQRLDAQAAAVLQKASLHPQQLLEQINSALGETVGARPCAPQQDLHEATEAVELDDTYSDTILIAEDVIYDRRLLEVILERSGYKILSCANGAELLDLARKNRFALIILDMQMSRIDGLEATRIIRKIPSHASTPIVALIARTSKSDIQRCLQSGCTDYLAKPVHEHVLLEKISKYLSPSKPGRGNVLPSLKSIEQSLDSAAIQSSLADDPELMKVVGSYVEELPKTLSEMIQAQRNSDFKTITALAHNLKGSSGLAGFPDLAAQAAKIHEAAQEQKPEDVLLMLKELIELCRMVGARMNELAVDVIPSAQIDQTLDANVKNVQSEISAEIAPSAQKN